MSMGSTRQFLVTFIPSIAILAAVVAMGMHLRVEMDVLTRDVAAIANIHPLSGVLSNLGILLWCAAASVCAFAAIAVRHVTPREGFRFLLSSALLSAYLLLDDLFLFHDELARRYLGLDQIVIYAALAVAVSVYLVAFRRVILRTNFGMLLLALGFLATSVVIDAIFEPWLARLGQWQYLIEDGAKWLGIACWCSYYVRTSHQLLVGAVRGPGNLTEPGPEIRRR